MREWGRRSLKFHRYLYRPDDSGGFKLVTVFLGGYFLKQRQSPLDQSDGATLQQNVQHMSEHLPQPLPHFLVN